MLRLAGNHIRDEVLASFLRLVCHASDLQAYAVQRLYAALHEDLSQASQTLAAVWVMGEFGEVLFDLGHVSVDGVQLDASPRAVIDLFTSLLDSVYAEKDTREFVLTALAKLHTRMRDTAQQARIVDIFQQHVASVDLEAQKRAIEYRALMDRGSLRDAVLEPMPLPEQKPTLLAAAVVAKPAAVPASSDLLLDLGGGTSDTAPIAPSGGTVQHQQSTQDLLADIFGGAPAATHGPHFAGAPCSAWRWASFSCFYFHLRLRVPCLLFAVCTAAASLPMISHRQPDLCGTFLSKCSNIFVGFL